MEIMTDKAAIVAGIASVANRGKKLDGDIQNLALATANHAHLHGDVTLLNDLYKALGKGVRHAAMTAWLLAFAPVVANKDKASKAELPFSFEKAKKASGDELEKLMAEGDAEGSKWYDMKPSPNPDQVFDAFEKLKALLKSADNASNVKGADLLHVVKQAVEAYDKTHGTTIAPPSVVVAA